MGSVNPQPSGGGSGKRKVLVLFCLFCSARASPLCCFWWQDNALESISLFR